MFARPLRLALPTSRTTLRQLHSHRPLRTPLATPKRAAIEPFAFVLAFGLSATAAFIVDRYTKEDIPVQTTPANTPDQNESLALDAQKYPDVMSAQMPPGRPGNLTPEQEIKLKEMWAQTLEVCSSPYICFARIRIHPSAFTPPRSPLRAPLLE